MDFRLMNMTQDVSIFIDKCRCCLKDYQLNITYPLQGHFEDLFFEVTNYKLKLSNSLSEKICIVCNDELTKISIAKRVLVENQLKLMNMLEKDTEGTSVDPLIKLEMVDFPVVKQEPVETSCDVIKSEEGSQEEMKTLVPTENFTVHGIEQIFGTASKPKKKKSTEKPCDVPNDLFCPHCDKLYTRKSILRHHIAAVHSKILRFNCNMDGCEYACYQKGNLTIHQRNVHNVPGTKTYFCETCGAVYKSSDKLKHHQDVKHLQKKNFGCDICGRWFYEKGVIREHIKTHMVYRELFKCDFQDCTTETTTKALLRYHKRAVHDKIRNFECHCGKRFAQKAQLKSHQKYFHDKIKDVQCDQCSKLLGSGTALKMHKAVMHPVDGKKPEHPCDVCGVTFSTVQTLNWHLKVHSEPTFACDHCDKKFFRKGTLQDHQEHHETLEFPCQHCTRSFRADYKLKHHLNKVHFKEKTTYRCELCSSTFTRRTTYRDHVLRQHKHLDANFRKDLLQRIAKMLPEEKTAMQSSD